MRDHELSDRRVLHPTWTILVVTALILSGCAGATRARLVEAASPAAVVPDFVPGDLEMAIVPTPVEDRPGALLHPVRGGEIVAVEGGHARSRREVAGILGEGEDALVLLGSSDRNGALHAFLRATRIEIDWTWLGPEGYHLVVRPHEGRLVVVVAANTPVGVLWGVETLRQITWRGDGVTWVRAGTVRDRPALPDRGSKRPEVWESGYKASFAWEKAPQSEAVDRGRRHFVPTFAPGERLDVSKAAVEQVVRFFREWSIRGSRSFAVRFDDVGFLLDRPSGTDERFGGEYAVALTTYLRQVRDGVHRFDRGARLYWLPQTYHESHPRLVGFAEEIAAAGGVPSDIGLVVTGPHVTSERIPAESVRRMRRLFGLTETPALIYDNRGRDRDFTPLRGRGPDLMSEVSGVFGERGTRVNRITRLDWNWNPEAYRPDRSLLLAVRELAGPSAFASTLALVRALGAGGQRPSPERSERLRELLRDVERDWADPDWRPGLDRAGFLQELRHAVVGK